MSYVRSQADLLYGDLLNRLGWIGGEGGPRLLFELDVCVGERLFEAEGNVVDAVRRLHAPRSFSGDGYGWRVCVECRQAWPCATEETLRQVTGCEPGEGWEAWA